MYKLAHFVVNILKTDVKKMTPEYVVSSSMSSPRSSVFLIKKLIARFPSHVKKKNQNQFLA